MSFFANRSSRHAARLGPALRVTPPHWLCRTPNRHQGEQTMRAGSPFKLALCLALAIPLALGACGGGGGGGTPMAGSPGGSGPAPGGNGASGPTAPVTVSFNDHDIRSIHLEVSDNIRIPKHSFDNVTGAVVPVGGSAGQVIRSETVCPGVPPRGNECTTSRFRIDGGNWHTQETVDDATLLFGLLNGVYWTVREGTGNDSDTWRAYGRTNPNIFVEGGYGSHMAYATLYRNDSGVIETQSLALGNLYSGRPTALPHEHMKGFWTGRMTGATRKEAILVLGDSHLEYDFSNNTLDFTLQNMSSNIHAAPDDPKYTGPRRIQWPGLTLNADGSFYIRGHGNDKAGTNLHPELGYIDGDLYGPNAEEFAGVFERQFGNDGDALVGAFGGRRVRAEDLQQ